MLSYWILKEKITDSLLKIKRLFRDDTNHCQHCKHSDHGRGKMKKTILRRSMYIRPWREKSIRRKEYWHEYCTKKHKYYPWDSHKRCFEPEYKGMGMGMST